MFFANHELFVVLYSVTKLVAAIYECLMREILAGYYPVLRVYDEGYGPQHIFIGWEKPYTSKLELHYSVIAGRFMYHGCTWDDIPF